MEIYWIALYANNNKITYFNRFRVEHIPKEMENFIGNKSTIRNSYGIQA